MALVSYGNKEKMIQFLYFLIVKGVSEVKLGRKLLNIDLAKSINCYFVLLGPILD